MDEHVPCCAVATESYHRWMREDLFYFTGCGCDCIVGLPQYAGELAKLGMPFDAEDCAFLLR